MHHLAKSFASAVMSQMADGHLGLGSNVQLGLVDFKVCDWPPETNLNGQSQTLKSC